MAGLQLSGLASGMDWQSVVEQLMELERFPIRRMEAEKALNDQKNIELSILSSKLDQVSSAADKLTDSSLWNARSVALSDSDTSLISVSAGTGTLTGEYVVSDATRATVSVLYGNSDMTSNITGASVIDSMDVATDVHEGTFTINGTIFTVLETGGTGGTEINLDEDLSTAAATIVAAIADISGAGVTDGKFYLDSSSEIILGHADDSSNFLSVLKLFSQSELNHNTTFGIYAEEESAATTSTTKIHRQGDYVYDTTGYYPVLTDAPRGADLSGAPNSYFGDLIPLANEAYQVTGIDGDGTDSFDITINGTTKSVTWQGTAADTAAALKAAIEADVAINGDVFVSQVGDDLIISEQTAGDITAFSTAFTDNGGAVAAAMSDSQVFDGTQGAPDGYQVRSEFAIGSVNVSDSIRNALGGLADGTYEFDVNGQSFTVKNSADLTNSEIDLDNTTMQQFMDKITASSAGVTMSYNPIEDRFVLTSKETGEIKITATDTSNSLLQTMYLDSEVSGNGTLDLGVDATLTINGTVVTSTSNDVTGTSHMGILP
jgi:flagellar capping protein FliD